MKILASENWDDRKNGALPSFVVLHYTGTLTAKEASDRFVDVNPVDGIGRISPHYMIDGDGEVIRFVDEDKRAWHAGKSFWKNHGDMNSHSIGIEIWNTGHEHNFESFLPVQIDSLIDLIADIRTRWPIPDANILGHSDIAPGRKIDPGEKFPWRTLEINGIGLMPEIDSDQGAAAESQKLVADPSGFYGLLKEFGYAPDIDETVLLREFRRHYLPHLLAKEELDVETCSGLLSLIRQSRI